MSIRQAMMTTAIVMALAMTAVVLPGCGTAEAQVDLNGTEWRLVSWSDTEVDPTPHEITLAFEDCNRYIGRLSVLFLLEKI